MSDFQVKKKKKKKKIVLQFSFTDVVFQFHIFETTKWIAFYVLLTKVVNNFQKKLLDLSHSLTYVVITVNLLIPLMPWCDVRFIVESKRQFRKTFHSNFIILSEYFC